MTPLRLYYRLRLASCPFRMTSTMFPSLDLMLRDMEDPLQGHPRYEKIRWASGSKDNVQIALDRQCNKTVAVKFFPRGSAISDYVRREILHHAELHHANVVALYHVFLTSGYVAPASHTRP